MVAAVKGVVALARRAAQRRGQEPSTAHLLLVLLHGPGPASGLLAEHGVREVDLLGALRILDGEASATFERVFERARELARTGPLAAVDELHLLLAILRDSRSAAYRCIEAVGAHPVRLREGAASLLGIRTGSRAVAGATPRALAPAGSARLAPPPQDGRARPRALAMESRSGRGPLAGSPGRVAGSKKGQKSSSSSRPDRSGAPLGATARATRTPSASSSSSNASSPRPSSASSAALDPGRFPLLTSLGRDLRTLAEEGSIDPVVGREVEIEQLLDILARRRSNNPILVGPPGVGKTAVVEGLALRLVEGGNGTSGLADRRLIELSAGALVAGTGVRGALSDRLRQLKEEVARLEGGVVLFIDEIHAVVGGGEGPDDLAHELKAALARGELPCIGATTETEYHRHFEKDAALARRFCPVHVEEPSIDQAKAILAGVAPHYAEHHGVRIDEDALEAAVELSIRFLPDRRLPDKAVGIVDQAAARAKRRGQARVGRPSVAAVVSELARVPLERLLWSDGERLLRLESILAERVVGHHEPLARIADALRKSAAGLSRGRPPSFLLLGPTGVGKTETARAIGDVFFPGTPMTHIDMSELGESHSVARLLGAPPGYLGHEQGGQLTESVRRRPYQLVLLDEIDKAHTQVWMSLLPLLEEGHLTDGRGRRVDFRNTIIVMTSNLGVEARSNAAIGFSSSGPSRGDGILERARRAMPPELWNRIDEPLVFAPLGVEEVGQIAERLLERVAARLREEHAIILEIAPSAIQSLIAAGGYDPELGARPMRRTIARTVESPLAAGLVGGSYPRGARLRLEGAGAAISVVRVDEPPRGELESAVHL